MCTHRVRDDSQVRSRAARNLYGQELGAIRLERPLLLGVAETENEHEHVGDGKAGDTASARPSPPLAHHGLAAYASLWRVRGGPSGEQQRKLVTKCYLLLPAVGYSATFVVRLFG